VVVRLCLWSRCGRTWRGHRWGQAGNRGVLLRRWPARTGKRGHHWLVTHLTRNEQVRGSIPRGGSASHLGKHTQAESATDSRGAECGTSGATVRPCPYPLRAATGASAAASRNCAAVHCGSLSNGSIRYIHFIISGALKRAVRWRWIATNPIAQAAPPPQPKPNPQPPTTAQAVRILNEAWQDPDWAMLVWLTMVTGFRRGELCAIPVAPRRSRRWCADGGAEHRPAQRTDL
jgi:hypothetical protein